MELTQCINYLLTTAQHSVFQFLSSKLSEYDITPSQYGVLSCLWQRDFATPKQISEILCLETSTISGVLDRMQKKGLIDRVINKEDRREVRVVPTEKGKALEEPISKIIDDVNEEVLRCFTEEEIGILKNKLRIIAEGSHYLEG
ncbi:MAG: MarR family transcriptional regulator [Anaerotignum sp.]|nr:MarR family transcriptional regulator [Anaerotignum sp.]